MDWATHERKWKNCRRCPLHKTRKKVVLGMGRTAQNGKPGASCLVVGQHPGENEDRCGLPHQGQGGRWTHWAVAQIAGLDWNSCFHTNILGCLPQGSLNKKLIAACAPRVYEVIDLTRPRVILSMGLVAAKFFTGDSAAKMTKIAGTHEMFSGRHVFFTTHPFEPARQKTIAGRQESEKKTIREFEALRDFCTEMGLIEREVE